MCIFSRTRIGVVVYLKLSRATKLLWRFFWVLLENFVTRHRIIMKKYFAEILGLVFYNFVAENSRFLWLSVNFFPRATKLFRFTPWFRLISTTATYLRIIGFLELTGPIKFGYHTLGKRRQWEAVVVVSWSKEVLGSIPGGCIFIYFFCQIW